MSRSRRISGDSVRRAEWLHLCEMLRQPHQERSALTGHELTSSEPSRAATSPQAEQSEPPVPYRSVIRSRARILALLMATVFHRHSSSARSVRRVECLGMLDDVRRGTPERPARRGEGLDVVVEVERVGRNLHVVHHKPAPNERTHCRATGSQPRSPKFVEDRWIQFGGDRTALPDSLPAAESHECELLPVGPSGVASTAALRRMFATARGWLYPVVELLGQMPRSRSSVNVSSAANAMSRVRYAFFVAASARSVTS